MLSLRIVMGDEDWVQWRDAKTTAARICDTLMQGVIRVRGK
jgi:hypothetical protein